MRGAVPKYPSIFIAQNAVKGLSFFVHLKFKLSNYATKETCRPPISTNNLLYCQFALKISEYSFLSQFLNY